MRAKILIDVNGNLNIEKNGTLYIQDCPYQSSMRSCGYWCPKLVISEKSLESNLVNIDVCGTPWYTDNFIDFSYDKS